jgi:thiol-disulfide isomerase/thioredoxin
MKRIVFFLGLILLGGVLWAQSPHIKVMDFEQLEPLLHQQNDTVYVVNFWATWCKPCIEEMPYFLETAREHQVQKVKFLFVSLDFPKQLDARLLPFVTEHMQGQTVVLLNDPAVNTWIGKVHPSWSGAIPATIIYKGASRNFIEGALTKEELEKYIKSKL